MQMKKLLAFLACLLMVCSAAGAEEAAPILEVHQMALGIADGYLLRCGDVEIMIDGGNANPASPTEDVLNYLRAAGVETLDLYIVTHWHLDHCMNMNPILAEFGNDQTVVYGATDSVPDQIFNGSVTAKIGPVVNGEYRQMVMGDVVEIGGLTLTCIGPRSLVQDGQANSDSLNVLIEYGSRKFLFTGDLAQSGTINNEYKELCADIDVLKFPHHGIEPFEVGVKAMRILRPDYILVPGLVKPYALWNYFDNYVVKLNVKTIYTNADGHVVILTDGGERFEVLTQQNPADWAPEQ